MALTQIAGPGVGRMLAIGTLKGYWTLEHLDNPSPGWKEIESDRVRSLYPADSGMGRPTMRYPAAGTRRPYRNLARDWIAANPKEWAELQEAHTSAALPASPDRDPDHAHA